MADDDKQAAYGLAANDAFLLIWAILSPPYY
ncbi:hypothetical protein DEHRE_03855 [Dehalobacter restrictus DSM 9455]|uniref:Uncharacterized protein n=1 Tax=Dehalobacter restrictus (strain DSM 9455 / PER-K23) TaxID=871738 RepID=A0ABN4BVN3_DEHRP|nr:hypothetical protein DEHRE_03855 [Dehalobacter restrictus DSM 9455]